MDISAKLLKHEKRIITLEELSVYNVFLSVISGLEFGVWGYKTSITIGKCRSAFSAKAVLNLYSYPSLRIISFQGQRPASAPPSAS